MLTDTEYTEVSARLDTYNEWAKQFVQRNGWTVIPAAAVRPVEVTNEDRSSIEVYRFMRDKPDRYFLYVDESTSLATTWTGQKLGRVVFGREYRDSFGGRRVPVSILAITGEHYHGTYYKSSGTYARVRKSKRPLRAV